MINVASNLNVHTDVTNNNNNNNKWSLRLKIVLLITVLLSILCLAWYVYQLFTVTHKYSVNDRRLNNAINNLPIRTKEGEWQAKNQKEPHLFNQVFGKEIYCICLKSRDDRYDHAVKQLQRIGMKPDDITFYRPEKDRRGGPWGCWESHRAACKMGWDSGAPYWLVVEDDLNFDDHWEKHLRLLAPFLAKNQDWQIMNLHHHGVSVKPYDDNVYQGYGMSCVGYVMSRRYMEFKNFNDGWIAKANGQHIDVAFFVHQQSPLYTPMTFYVNKDIIKPDIELTSDNQKGVVVETAINVFGQEGAYNLFKVWNEALAKVDSQLPRHVMLATGIQEEKDRLNMSFIELPNSNSE